MVPIQFISQAIFKKVELVMLALSFGITAPLRADVVVEPHGAMVAGKTISEWTTNWWQWGLSFGPFANPFYDSQGGSANLNQSGPVFFLAGSPGGSNSRRFEVPSDTYILMPLLVGEWSQLELGFDKSAAEVRQAASQQADLIDSLHTTLDGVPIPQTMLFTHREVSPDFDFVATSGNALGVPAGASGIAVADGYFLMLQPLSPGTHVLTYGGGASAFGIFLSQTDTITVGAPKITTQPTNQTVVAGATVSLAVGAVSGLPLNYQWYFSPEIVPTNGPYGQAVSNANASTLTFTAKLASAGVYWVMVTNGIGRADSSLAVLTVLPKPPSITAQPVDQAVFTGSNAVFSVSAATTNPPLSFQWQFNGMSLLHATNDTLIISNAQIANIGEYRVVVSDWAGSTNSTPADLTLLDRPPFIIGQPASVLVSPGSNAVFTVEAGGAGPLSYQWQFDQASISGATAATLVISNVQLAQAGSYAVVVTNNFGAVTSSPARLRLGWIRTHSGPGNQSETAQDVAVDGDGNVIVTGYSTDGTESDYYTVKYAAASGGLLWEKYHTNGIAAAVAVDSANNVIVTGSSGSFDGNQGLADYLTVKYAAADGAVIWERRYNGPANWNDYALAVAADGSNNVVVTGNSGNNSGQVIPSKSIKYLPNGTPIWTNAGSPGAVVQAMALDRSNNVVVTGYSWNGTNDDCYTAKYAAASGELLWEKSFNGQGNSDDRFYAVAIDASNNVTLVGNTGIWPNNDFYTAKYGAADGALLWDKSYNGPGNYFDRAQAVAVDNYGNVMVTGSANNTSGDSDYYTAKYAAADGTLLWEQRYSGPSNSYDDPWALVVDRNGDVIVAGYSFAQSGGSDYYLAKYASADGTLLWDYRYPNGGANSLCLTLDEQGNVICAGSTGTGDFLTLKIFLARPEIPIYRFTSIIFTNGDVRLEWTPGTGFVLQQTPSLTIPNWQTVGGSQDTNRIAIPATNSSAFFRLAKP